MLAPKWPRPLPCRGSGGMTVSSERFFEAYTCKVGDSSIFGQGTDDSNWRLANKNLPVRSIDGHVADADSFHNNRRANIKANDVLANMSLNHSDRPRDLAKENQRGNGVPPAGNADTLARAT